MSMDPQLTALHTRLDRIEPQLSRLRRIALFSLTLNVGLIGLLGYFLWRGEIDFPGQLKVRGLQVRDPQSQRRLELITGEAIQYPMLALSDDKGIRRLSFGLEPDGSPVLFMRNEEGQTNLLLHFVDKSLPQLTFWGPDKQTLWKTPLSREAATLPP